MEYKTEIWAHRGASGDAPENTMPAFDLALKQGADAIEIDVQVSSDGEVVVCHDEHLNRLAGFSGMIVQTPWNELKAIDIAHEWPDFPPLAMPRLQELLEFLEPHNIGLNIELKNSIIPMPSIERRVYVMTRSFARNHRVIFSSFNHQSLMTLLDIDPSLEVAPLYSNSTEVDPFLMAGFGVRALHPQWSILKDQDYVQRCRSAGLKIHCWTVNQAKDMRRIMDARPDAIITDVPGAMRRYVEEYQAQD